MPTAVSKGHAAPLARTLRSTVIRLLFQPFCPRTTIYTAPKATKCPGYASTAL